MNGQKKITLKINLKTFDYLRAQSQRASYLTNDEPSTPEEWAGRWLDEAAEIAEIGSKNKIPF